MYPLFIGAVDTFNLLKIMFVLCDPDNFRIAFLSFDLVPGDLLFLLIDVGAYVCALILACTPIHNKSIIFYYWWGIV